MLIKELECSPECLPTAQPHLQSVQRVLEPRSVVLLVRLLHRGEERNQLIHANVVMGAQHVTGDLLCSHRCQCLIQALEALSQLHHIQWGMLSVEVHPLQQVICVELVFIHHILNVVNVRLL